MSLRLIMKNIMKQALGFNTLKNRLKTYIRAVVDEAVEASSQVEKINQQRQSRYQLTSRLASCLQPGQASPHALFGSSLCRAEDLINPVYQAICRDDLRCEPVFHRKQWEFVYIVHQLRMNGFLRQGFSGLGFGVGTEPLSSLFASLGCTILATDAPDNVSDEGWKRTAQHASALKQLWHSKLIPWENFAAACTFQALDMRDHDQIPMSHDFHWSSCVIEHIGGIRAAHDFLLASTTRLNPGGIAVHTTEFNLSSDLETVDEPGTCVFRARDLQQLKSELKQQGLQMDPLILDPGMHAYNYHVDAPPYDSKVHLRLLLERFAATSIGIVIRKPG
jgi:hypothetical protein